MSVRRKPPARTRRARLAAAARRAARWLASPAGRGAGRLLLVTVGAVVAVVLLYAHGDPSGKATAAPPRTTAAAPTTVPVTVPPTKKPAPEPATPTEVAVAAYAARHDLPARKVRALQQDRVDGDTVQVLVLAERGREKVTTALVTVDRRGDRWEAR